MCRGVWDSVSSQVQKGSCGRQNFERLATICVCAYVVVAISNISLYSEVKSYNDEYTNLYYFLKIKLDSNSSYY